MNNKAKNALIILLLMAVLPVCSQNMRVAGFRHVENDFTASASSTNSVKDGNGDLTALVKVVVPIEGFNFSGGDIYGVVKVEPKEGVYWVYVPNQTLSLIITHARFNPLNYSFPVAVRGGQTYELLLDPGNGQYVTLQGSRPDAKLILDGNYVKKDTERGAVYNQYISYGVHTLKAISGKFEGTLEFNISANDTIDGSKQRVLTVQMTDQSAHYGQGRITVDGNADIYHAGERVGSPGYWDFDLREGTYEIETRKTDHEPERTTITVKPGSEGNDAKVKAPTPHTGWLNVFTRPRSNITATDNGLPIDLSSVQTLPIGTHQISVSRKGFVTQQHEYTIRRNETTRDTVTLERIQYIRNTAFYFGAGYTLRSLSGITGVLGLVFHHHDIQGSYTLGLDKTKQTNWSDSEGNFLGAAQHKINSFGLKYGYQISIIKQLALTPMIGYSCNIITSSKLSGSKSYADGAMANFATIGTKVLYAPIQHGFLFLLPEYDVCFKKDASYNAAAKKAGFDVGGFSVTAGLLVNF